MATDDQIRDQKNVNMILTKKLQKYQPYHQAKLTSPSKKKKTIEQGKFIYSSLGKAFEKQTKTIKY